MKKAYLILTFVFFLIILAGNLVYLFYFVKQVETRKMYMEVSDQRTILEQDTLFFGYGYPGSIADRTSSVYMTNNFGYTVVVTIKITGNISDFVAVKENGFTMAPGEKKILLYKADIPTDTAKGVYSGETRVVFTRALK